MMMDWNIKDTVRNLVQLLVSGEYDTLEQETKGIRLSAEQIQQALKEYGRHLRMPPEETFNSLDVLEVTGSMPRTWSVRCDLWTHEEGRSDLSLELTLIDEGTVARVEIDNIHVL